MGDPQFEEFRVVFEQLPQHIKATPFCYQIAHGIDVLMSEENIDSEIKGDQIVPAVTRQTNLENDNFLMSCDVQVSKTLPTGSVLPRQQPSVERKRRKLPQIPLDKKPLSKFCKWPKCCLSISLESENEINKKALVTDCKTEYVNRNLYLEIDASGGHVRPYLRYKCDNHYPTEDECSPEDIHERLSTDVDSGNSSSHTPDGVKSYSPANNDSLSCSSSSTLSSVPSASRLQLQDATHRGLHKFIPRHDDEIEVDIGDPVYVQKEADDYWYEGVNLRTGITGVFPSAYVTDVEYADFDSDGNNIKKERYLLDFLGSIEVTSHKGNDVLLQAVRKVVKLQGSNGDDIAHPCILEISDNGLRMVDRNPNSSNNVPSHDYFFNLKNVTFCGYHPYNHRYFGFVTKHPLKQKFACHILMGQSSTRDVAEAVGRAFRRFYQKFMETMYPVEDIYLE